MMEVELEPRVRPLPYKVKAMSRESPAQKAAHVLDPDLRNHWSTATNTKEWILLELDEPCLLSHIQIYNKAVLEWEITVGLRYKPEAFVKVRPRCEAPRRDVLYPMNYTPCRYVRISCLRGNPIAIFFIQLIGVSVSGLEPEFQPVVNYLLPHIIANKQDAQDMHLQLLQDMTTRLLFLLPQLEAELTSFADAADSNIRFLAMLCGPFYPILHIVNEREAAKALLNFLDSDALKNNQTSTLTVSSNFEAQPRRPRSPSPFIQPASSSVAFRSDAAIMLLRKAYKDSHLGTVCRIASRALQKLVEPIKSPEEPIPTGELASSSTADDITKSEVPSYMHLANYSGLFGKEFKIPDDHWDASYLNVLDIAAVEEGILHVLYACASQPLLCHKLAESNSDFLSILPLVQALLPALRPRSSSPGSRSSSPDHVDDSFWQWKQLCVQHALSQIVTMSSSSVYHPLLRSCAGYLSSFLSSHAKAACVLIDLCSGPFSPWICTIVAKVDLTIELLEDLLGIIQGARQSITRARAALKYIILALSGHMDDMLSAYKEVKHKLLFLLEMLEPFLDPAITSMKSTIAFGDVSTIYLEKQERTCAVALNVIRTAVRRPAVLPSLEAEWRRGSVAPSVLLSILGPHMPLPPDIDLCKCSVSKVDHEPFAVSHGVPSKSNILDEADGKIDASEEVVKLDVFEDANLLFAPSELKKTILITLTNVFIGNCPDRSSPENNQVGTEGKQQNDDSSTGHFLVDNSFSAEYFNLQADYLQLVNHQDCESKATEFQHLALDLCSQHDISPEGHAAAIDALLLAAECYVNPFFTMSFGTTSKLINQMNTIKSKIDQINDVMEFDKNFPKYTTNLGDLAQVERRRDEIVLQILLQAAKLDRDYQKSTVQGDSYPSGPEVEGLDIPLLDIRSADAVTLVRKNQVLLCHFVMQQLHREQHSSHEILMHSLLFLLYSATALFCPPENVIDIILQSAENLNRQLTSLYYQLKEGNSQSNIEKLHGAQRHWVILQRLVIASSGNDDGSDFISHTKNGFRYRTLIPPSAWMNKIPNFSNCPCPLPRFLGWMAVSRYAKQYLNERLLLVSDFSQLTSLLSIFADELASIDSIIDHKIEASIREHPDSKHYMSANKGFGHSDQLGREETYPVAYPDLHKFFPSMKKQFRTFGEVVLEAVGLHLECLPCCAVPDVLSWFSDLCLCPYSETIKDHPSFPNTANNLKGYAATSAKAIILYVLESIVREHMEAMIPEMTTIAHILVSLCKASYCDTAFLDSLLCLLSPMISYFLRRTTDGEDQLTDTYSHADFELSFEEVFDSIRHRKEYQDSSGEHFQGSLMIFILGTLIPDLSFMRVREVLQSFLLWVDFTTSEPTSSFYNYLCAFHKVITSCTILLVQNLKALDINIPVMERQLSEAAPAMINLDGSLNISHVFPASADQSCLSRPTREFECINTVSGSSDQWVCCLSLDEAKDFHQGLELFISKLLPSIEASWKLHYQLASKLTLGSAECILLSRCLSSIKEADITGDGDEGKICSYDANYILPEHWRNALEGLTVAILTIQQNQGWQVASSMLDYLLALPQDINLDCVVSTICSVIKNFCCHAPRFSWRLQTGKWLSSLFMRSMASLDGAEASLVDLLCTMLGNSEPEQRSIAFQILGKVVGLDTYDGVAKSIYTLHQNLDGSNSVICVPEPIISILVSRTWDRVTTLALSDPSMPLRTHAMALLFGYIPFSDQTQLQSFLVASNTLLCGTWKLYPSMEEGHLSRLSLVLLASACLHSPAEDIPLIPESVWRNLESMGMSKAGAHDDMEKNLCLILCKLRTESDSARVALKEVLSSNPAAKKSDPNFKSTRESILQVISSLTSVRSYFDFFSKKCDQESQELVEAEIEMDILQREKALQEPSSSLREEIVMPPDISCQTKATTRLQQIKDDIRSIEKSELREEIIVRRQKKMLMRHARQKYLEDAAAREMELLQELDRERATKVEHEIEMQRQLELERAKTRELQFNLNMERERQTQKEFQRELEQVESGIRSSQRDYSSNPNSRTREKYREGDNRRSGHEGGLRSSSRGREGQATTSSNAASVVPTIMLAGSRSFSGQLPTILQSRDRTEDDNFEGSRDSGDTSSTGDPELASAFDGLPGVYGSGLRYGSRGSKSRPIADRRERDGGRREGKWERKH